MNEIRTYDEYSDLEFILSGKHRQLHEDDSITGREAYNELVQLGDRSILKSTPDNEENAHYCED